MRIDKSQVNGARFMFTIACFLQSSALLTSLLADVTKQDSWIAVVSATVLYLPLIYLLRTLMVRFPGKDWIEILEEVYGPIAGKVIGLAYAWFFFTLTALNLRDLGNFSKIAMMTETPHAVLTFVCILVAAWAVRYGFKVVGRYSALFTIVEFALVAVTTVLLYNQFNLKNFLPILHQPFPRYVQSTHVVSAIPIGEVVAFIMINPCIKLSPKEMTKYWYAGMGMGMLTMLVVLLRDTAILGNTIHLFTLPGLVTLRLVSLGEALSRIEIIFAVGLMMLLFFKVTVLCYVTTITVAQIFKTAAYKRLALIIGIFTVVYIPTLYPNAAEHITSSREIAPFVWTLLEAVIPLVTFFVAKIRKKPLPNAAALKGAA